MLKWNDVVIEQNRFPDGALRMETPLKAGLNMGIQTIIWQYENDAELFALNCLADNIRSRYDPLRLNLQLPYLPHARMDRAKKATDVFTLKTFANMLNNMRFHRVHVLDPHSNVSAALINNIDVLSPEYYINDAIHAIGNPDLMLFYPDEGAMKRYSEMINKPYCFGVKNRDWETGKILSLSVLGQPEEIYGRDVLIVDDICSRGGTFLHSARKLKEIGAKNIYLYVTHCENTILEGECLDEVYRLDGDLIRRIYTTDSIFTKEHPKIEVFKIYE